jgi:UDP-N-acetylmuramoyl-tripeptide--D-alanyl-D-alanine ligase
MPDVAVITSVGPTHLQRLGGVEQVAIEKAGILRELGPKGLGIVTADSPELDKVLRRHKGNLVRFGAHSEAQLRLTGYQAAGSACRFELNGRLWVNLMVPGRHNATNALAAIAVAQWFAITQEDAAAALADFAGVDMRLQAMPLGPVTLVNDAYNANPMSVLAAADVLADLPGGRKVMVLGDMRELGERARELHLQTGGELATRAIDLVVGVGPLGQLLAAGAADAGLTAVGADDLDAAVAELSRRLAPGDVVLLKGSRAMGLEGLIEPLRAALAPGRQAKAVKG